MKSAAATLLILALPVIGLAGSLDRNGSTSVQLLLDDERLLPGAPTGLTVTVANRGLSPIRIPSQLWIVASTIDGRSFPLRNLMEERGEPVADEMRTIPPGTTRELRFDATEVVQGTRWVLDERVVTPGRYSLRAVLAESVDAYGQFDVANSLSSKPVVHVVAEPSGDDAAVWRWMQEKAGGAWGEKAWFEKPGLLATFVLEEHPQSEYALYTGIWVPWRDVDRKNALLERLTAAYSARSYTEQLKLALARRYESEYTRAYQAGDMVRAAAQLAKARDLVEPLEHHARSATARSEAARILHELPDPGDFRRRASIRQ